MSKFYHHPHFRTVLSVFSIFVLLLGLVPSQFAFADANRLYITPASSQMEVGTPFTVNVRSFVSADSSGTGSANGTVLYTANLLQVTSISIGGSAYGSPTISQGNGTITFNSTMSSGASGTYQIFAITFQTKAAGSATVGFSGSSEINGQSTTFSTSTFTVTQPASSPSPTPSSSSPPKASTAPVVTTPVQSTAPTPTTENVQPTPDPTGIITGVVATPSYTSATVTWTVNAQNPKSGLSYGSDSTALNKSAVVTRQSDGSFIATITGLTPGQEYYFSITGGGSNVADGTYSSTIPTSGYPVTITVTENHVAASSAQVQIGTLSYTTQQNGKVTVGLGAGNYSGKISTNDATLNINLTVKAVTIPTDGSAPEAQPLSFNLTATSITSSPNGGSSILTFIIVIIVGGIILVFGFLIFINIRRHKFDDTTDAYHMSAGPSVIVQDDYSWNQDAGSPAAPPPPPPTYVQTAMPEMPQHPMNSVYLSEEEPLDMFEKAKLDSVEHPTTTPSSGSGTPQIPNLPHSTTP